VVFDACRNNLKLVKAGSRALVLITPPNLGSGGGSCFPSIVVVAAGDEAG
jgi:hypothetical protein